MKTKDRVDSISREPEIIRDAVLSEATSEDPKLAKLISVLAQSDFSAESQIRESLKQELAKTIISAEETFGKRFRATSPLNVFSTAILAVVTLALLGSVLGYMGLSMVGGNVTITPTNSNWEIASSIEELQKEVGTWYPILYPSYLPDGMEFQEAVYAPQVRDTSLIFTCGDRILYIVQSLVTPASPYHLAIYAIAYRYFRRSNKSKSVESQVFMQ